MFSYICAFLAVSAVVVDAQGPNGTTSCPPPYSNTQILDDNGEFVIKWGSNPQGDRIEMELTVNTTGWISLGLLSPNG